MKAKDPRTTAIAVGALITGWLMGASGIASSQAEDAIPTPVVQGEVIKVCINSKTGVIRAASKCDSKNERKTVLGGVGPRGEVGAQGIQGVAGPQGLTGPKGDAGSISGLKTETIYYYDGRFGSYCSAGLLGNYPIAAISTSGRQFTASPCKKDVFVP